MKSGSAKFGVGADADLRQGTLSFGSRASSLRVAAQQQQMYAQCELLIQGLQAQSDAELAVEAAQTGKEA